MLSSTSSHRLTRVAGWLARCDRAISRGFLFRGSQAMAWGAGIGILLLAVFTLVGVTGRRVPFLSGPWARGSIELSEASMAMVSVLALMFCWYIGGHLHIDLLKSRYSPKTRAALDAVFCLLGAFFAATVAWSMWDAGMFSLSHHMKTLILGVPRAPFQFVFSLAMMYFTLVLLRSFLGFAAKASGRHTEHDGLY